MQIAMEGGERRGVMVMRGRALLARAAGSAATGKTALGEADRGGKAGKRGTETRCKGRKTRGGQGGNTGPVASP